MEKEIGTNTKKKIAAKVKDSGFKVGQRVVLLDEGRYSYGPGNPTWGKNGKYIEGKITSVSPVGGGVQKLDIAWDNGENNSYITSDCTLGECEVIVKESQGKTVSSKLGKSGEIDFSKLDPLVIDPEVKQEITAVLKQHENSIKLFEEWGLGEVIEYGRGMTMLFWGGPGTGKTFAANCIAKALGMELLCIGAAEIQTSEPGGANRNIQQAFEAAKKEKKVLFIDECDSLITSRQQVGMIIGGEINTLLTEMEKYEGVVVLATNRIEELDEALERRISLIVEFPEPDHGARKVIWERILPKKMPLHDDVNATILADYNLTGGLIKNVLLAAARQAIANEQKHVTLLNFQNAINRAQKASGKMGSSERTRAFLGMGKSRKKDTDIDVSKTSQ